MLLPQASGRLPTWGSRLLMLLVPAALSVSGCAHSPSRSLARVWEDRPKMRWSFGKDQAQDEQLADAKLPEKSAGKSAVGGGTIGKTRMASKQEESPATSDSAEHVVKSPRKQSSPRDPFLEDELAARKRLAKTSKTKEQTDESTLQHVAQRDRLKATLSDESRRTLPPDSQSAEQARLRLRVEAMMTRAKLHLDREELAAAQRAAELAQNLTESGGLEFAPDEERPIELLTEIIARRDAEREQAALADSDPEATSESEQDEGEKSAAAKPRQRRVDPAFAFDQESEFDPYAERAVPIDVAQDEGLIFNTSMVVLESPAFDEEPEGVNPIGYTLREDDRLGSPTIEVSPAADRADAESLESPEPPVTEDSIADETELLIPPEDDDVAPAPPPAASDGPRFGGVSLDDIPSDLEEAEAPEEVRPAGIVPRWLPLSLLSLLTVGLCLWLWRHRAMLNS